MHIPSLENFVLDVLEAETWDVSVLSGSTLKVSHFLGVSLRKKIGVPSIIRLKKRDI